MAKRIGGFRRKTRYKLSKNLREKGKIGLSKFFQSFEKGDKVVLKAEPAYQKGMYHPRFHGSSGEVRGRKGECYIVQIKDVNKKKHLIVHPVHIKHQ